MEALYQPVKNDLDGKLPNEMWRDGMLIGFNGMLISYLLKTSLQNASKEEKGLAGMILWEKKVPGGTPRRGILSLDTTRGDRLFISLLSAAYIHLAWLGLVDASLWFATIISALFSIIVFRYV